MSGHEIKKKIIKQKITGSDDFTITIQWQTFRKLESVTG